MRVLLGAVLLAVVAGWGRAAVLEPDAGMPGWLAGMERILDDAGIDVLFNLNHRQLARRLPGNPRLGAFPDLPLGRQVESSELWAWEAEYSAGDIGALVLVPGAAGDRYGAAPAASEDLLQRWLSGTAAERVFVTFHTGDLEPVRLLAEGLASAGHSAMVFSNGTDAGIPGRFYATAGLRMALDSSSARRHRSSITELDWLGQRVRRDTDSLFADRERLTRNEPAVFRKHTLGDEFEASTIEEIIVPGGIALGEIAVLPDGAWSLSFASGALRLIDGAGEIWHLPPEEPAILKALHDFVLRSELLRSDAVVDIDADGRVRISSELRDTDAGFSFVEADTRPFEYVRGLPVTKSVIIDTRVEFLPRETDREFSFESIYEIRFLSADTMRIAQTRVALEYAYSRDSGAARYRYQWGRDLSRLDENTDYHGLGKGTESLARHAAWVALFRLAQQGGIQFLDGRYEFLKLDKQGRRTPGRY